jgi:hypothetical protein
MFCVFEDVIGADHINRFIRNGRSSLVYLNALLASDLSWNCIDLHTDLPATAHVREQVTAAAAEIQDSIGRFDKPCELGDIGPTAKLKALLLALEVPSVVVRFCGHS